MSRRFRRGFAIITIVLSLAVSAGVWAKVRAAQMDASATRLSEAGQGAIKLFKAYARGVDGAVETGSCAALSEHLEVPATGHPWIVVLESEIDGVRVFSWRADGERKVSGEAQLETVVDWIEELEKSTMKLAQIEEVHGDGSALARGVLWLRGRTANGEAIESQIHLRTPLRKQGSEWVFSGEIELIKGRTVIGWRSGFSDVTEAAGIDFQAHINPDWATPEWFPHTYQIVRFAQGGIAIADFDGDGWDDLFLGDGKRSRLYRNLGDGTFEDATIAAGLPGELGAVSFGLFADLDNDADQDFLIGGATVPNRLYRNDGGRFVDVTISAGLGGYFTTVAAAADIDNDGLLDLYIGRYLDPRTELPTTLFYTRNSEGNLLLKNLGDLRFEDATAEAGVREGGLTLGVAFADYDRDGDQDLYVANDFGRNALLRNEGDGSFTDVSLATGTSDLGYGMSAEFGDIDNDGDLDIYVSNVHSGNRWYGQAPTLFNYLITSFRQGTLGEDAKLYGEIYEILGERWSSAGNYIIKGNSLLLNDGHGSFEDVAVAANANPFGWYWGSAMFDYDNDGRQDMYTANGFVSGKTTNDL